ncbi:sulfatase-like hydrolase/transferase [Microbacterium alcoholitolerans]|uniref:sulfatase-like hydrolase/transferase n=1 Tax=unclassified Microbacterium TaxID=2609290 RepID=UPI003D16BE57
MNETSQGASRPNVVVVMTDDQGWWSMPNRMPELHMPHLEELMADGLELTRFYCASPVCSPARASMLTGRVPSAHGVHDWIVGDRDPQSWPDDYLAGQPSTPEILSRAGYQCWMSGKWHLGDASRPAPGFTRWYSHRYGGGPYVNAPVWRDGVPVDEPRYITHAITEEALGFLRDRDPNAPFYLQVNYTAPHDPWLEGHPDEYTSLYRESSFPSVPREPRHEWTHGSSSFDGAYDDPHPHLVGYCAALTAVDRGLGQILNLLEDEGIRDDTVVLFLSDNGFSCGHHGLWGKGNGTWPLNFWDSSVRVPMVASVPGGARGTSDALVSATALHSTVCELAGVEIPADQWRASESIAPLLRGESTQGADVVVIAAEYGMGRMITDGRWVYVHRRQGPDELYDRESDPGEQHNLIDDPSRAGLRDELHQHLTDWYGVRAREGMEGWNHDVRGFGQVHPVSRGLPDTLTYAVTPAPDGNSETD